MAASSAGYARVSTREQAANSQALEQQIARLKVAGAGKIEKASGCVADIFLPAQLP
jgi:DNA invertase Pin-like site-specific DNA recombinase